MDIFGILGITVGITITFVIAIITFIYGPPFLFKIWLRPITKLKTIELNITENEKIISSNKLQETKIKNEHFQLRLNNLYNCIGDSAKKIIYLNETQLHALIKSYELEPYIFKRTRPPLKDITFSEKEVADAKVAAEILFELRKIYFKDNITLKELEWLILLAMKKDEHIRHLRISQSCYKK